MGLSIGSQPRIPYSIGLDASKPSAPLTGDIFYATDTQTQYIWTGTVWLSTRTGNLNLIETKTLTNATDTTFSSLGTTQNFYLLILEITNNSDAGGTKISIQFNADGGANYIERKISSLGVFSIDTVATSLGIAETEAAATRSCYSRTEFPRVCSPRHPVINQNASWGNTEATYIGGSWVSASNITSVKILSSAGTITGTASLYGIGN